VAKEDFKNGAKPIDMSDFPYKTGDKLPGGITILSVIYGTAEDSFKGYWMKPVIEVRGGKKIYGESFILECTPFKDRDGRTPTSDPQYWPDESKSVEMGEIVGDPYAQRVVYRLDGEVGSHAMTPAEFLEFAERMNPTNKPTTPIPQTDSDQNWTPGDDEFITENYEKMSDAEMAKVLEVDAASLKRHRLDDLKLKKAGFGR